jgi:hypothetical protein
MSDMKNAARQLIKRNDIKKINNNNTPHNHGFDNFTTIRSHLGLSQT